MNKVSFKIIRSDNKEFYIDSSEWLIPNDGLNGWGEVLNELSTSPKANGDGAYYLGSRIAEKDRSIGAEVISPLLNETLRYSATAFFIPKYTYKIYVTYMGRTRWAEGRIYKFKCSEGNIYERVSFLVTFLFTSPFLKSIYDYGENIAEIVSSTGFPYMCKVGGTSPTSSFKFAKEVYIENNGHIGTYCKAIISAKNAVSNPKLLINDKWVRIIDELVKGDIIIIDFAGEPPTVTKNGVNALSLVDRESDFDGMKIEIGISKLEYDADAGDSNISVSIYYNQLFTCI